MALNDTSFAQKLKTIFDAMDSAAGGSPKNNQWFAAELAKAIDDQIKTAEIPSGKVIVSVSGNATGTPNPAPIKVV